MSQNSSTQSLNKILIQENAKNNCLKLIEFYFILNIKRKKINSKNTQIKNTYFQMTNKSYLNQFLYKIWNKIQNSNILEFDKLFNINNKNNKSYKKYP